MDRYVTRMIGGANKYTQEVLVGNVTERVYVGGGGGDSI
jgi:hypothetical protein